MNKTPDKKLSPKDIEQAIFRPKADESTVDPAEYGRNVVGYTVLGKQVKENDPTCYAKVVKNQNNEVFYITYGGDQRPYDPFGLYIQTEGGTRRSDSRRQPTMREVSPKVFQYYLKYLFTRNLAWFNNATREAI